MGKNPLVFRNPGDFITPTMPQRPISPRFAGLMIALLLGFSESRGLALIFNSTGDATYNTTPPTGSLTNSGWQWQGRWKGATGTPIAPHFFITAGHLGGNVGDTFLFNGVNYVTTGKNASPSSDLIVWQVGATFPSYAPLYTGSAEVGMNAVLFGRGVARGAAVNVAGLGEDALRGWQWMSTATAGTLRWGENTIESAQYFAPNDPFAANGQLLVMDFDRFNGSNSNEVTLGNFDSGGGLFIRDPVDNRWKLAGVNVDAEYAYRLTAGGATFNASIFDIGGLYYDEAGDVVGPVGADPFILGANGVTDTPSHLYSARISANIPWILGIPGFPPINTAPQISPVSNQTVDEGIPLMVTLTGSDADVPAQTLSYGLVSGPPGMTVTPGGVVSWTPNETQGGATVTVTVQVTDSGVPSMSAIRLFQVAVRDVPQLGRTVWQLGADAPTGSSGTVSSAEFSLENSKNDPAPGRVTRLPGDPLYVDAASNPRADDDFYFGGVYPGGFNLLTSGLSVPNDEPFSAWERAHTLGDRTNRIHFLLGSVQAAGATQYRLRVDLATGGSRIGTVVQPGFSEHDYVVRFRNGAGVTTQVYSNRLTQVTNLQIDFSAAQVAATLGANSLEMVRVGPATATDYWLIYDQVRLEVVVGGLGLSRVASGEAGAAAAYLRSPGSTGNSTVIHGRITLEGADYLTLTFGGPEPAPEGGSPQVESSEDLVHWSPADVVFLRDSVSEGWRTTMLRDLIPLGQTAQRFLRLRVAPGSFSRVPTNE